jgi:hypothetical protein
MYISGGTTDGDNKVDIVTVNFKVTESFLKDIDDTWQGAVLTADASSSATRCVTLSNSRLRPDRRS